MAKTQAYSAPVPVPSLAEEKGLPEIPNKLFFKIGEVSRITGVEPYILRYWESEFPVLRPRKNKSGQRVYVRGDLELILKIRQMLYQERYTIAGAKKRLAEKTAPRKAPEGGRHPQNAALDRVKKGLRELLAILEANDGKPS